VRSMVELCSTKIYDVNFKYKYVTICRHLQNYIMGVIKIVTSIRTEEKCQDKIEI
jgi:hypothetical protein